MVDTLSITLAQLNQSVGDMAGNAAAMLAARERAKAAGADLILFPEMQLVGYPSEDLVLKPAYVERATQALEDLAKATADGLIELSQRNGKRIDHGSFPNRHEAVSQCR